MWIVDVSCHLLPPLSNSLSFCLRDKYSMITHSKNNRSFIVGLFSATAASLCCITPLLAFLGGASGLASSFSWIEPFRPYLIGVTVVVFSFAWYQKLKRQKQVDCNCDTGRKTSFWQSGTFLGTVTVLAALLIAFPYYANVFYPKAGKVQVGITANTEIKQAEFKVEGMSCEGCIGRVNSGIAKVEGVINCQTSYQKANSIVNFDSSKTCVDSIVKAINSTGYTVTYQTLTKN